MLCLIINQCASNSLHFLVDGTYGSAHDLKKFSVREEFFASFVCCFANAGGATKASQHGNAFEKRGAGQGKGTGAHAGTR